MSNERLFYEDSESYTPYIISKKNICRYCKKLECICDLLDTTYNCVNCNNEYLYREYKNYHLKCKMCEEDYCSQCYHICRKIFNVKLLKNGMLPKKIYEQDAGFNLFCPIDIMLKSNVEIQLSLEIILSIPLNYYGQIKNRSSLYKRKIKVFEGVIDNNYRGEVLLLIKNKNNEDILLNKGDKIAQILISPIYTGTIKEVDYLDNTDRGEGGFGSTGK
jgi:dUTP pyrophosphatase